MMNLLSLTSMAHPRHMENDIAVQIIELFDLFPDLSGFSLMDRSPLPGDLGASGGGRQLYIADIAFSPPVDETERDETASQIRHVLNGLVRERPEAFDLLNGRSFTRTLHQVLDTRSNKVPERAKS